MSAAPITLTEQVSGDTPASNKVALYAKADGLLYSKDDAGTETILGASAVKQMADGRLTLTTATPVTTADVTAATTLYYTPYLGNRIAVYDGTAWLYKTFSELSIAVPANASTPNDIWIYDNAGTLTLESTAWTNDTTRATALAYQDGVLVKSGTVTRRFLGTIRTTGTSGQCEMSGEKAFVWNYYNQRLFMLKRVPGVDWTYSTNSFRQINNDTANQITLVCGVAENALHINYHLRCSPSGSYIAGVKQDAVNGTDFQFYSGAVDRTLAITAYYTPTVGYHFYAMVEYAGGGSSSQTGSGGQAQTAMMGSWLC